VHLEQQMLANVWVDAEGLNQQQGAITLFFARRCVRRVSWLLC
jgi:hypothetical protein